MQAHLATTAWVLVDELVEVETGTATRRDHPVRVARTVLGDAKRCYERAGRVSQWDAVVARVRADHRRKVGFIADFEKVVAGDPPASSTSFLDRAKARWSSRGGS